MEYAVMRSWFAVFGAFALVSASLWAAGAEDESAAAADKEYVTDPSTDAMVTAPEYGGTIAYGIPVAPARIDTQNVWSTVVFISGVMEKLGVPNWRVRRTVAALTTPNSIQEFLLTGLLAVSWEQPDGTTIVFKICSGVSWHDKAPMDGRRLTARDVEFSFHRVYGLGSGFNDPGPQYWRTELNSRLKSVEAIDEQHVVFELDQPYLDALVNILDHPAHFIVPPEVIKQHGDLDDWRNVVGTGPYELTDVVEGSSITWTKNPNYWRYDEKYPEEYRLPYADQLKALVMPDSATRLAALRSGKIDILGYGARTQITSIDDLQNLEQTRPEIKLWPWATRSYNVYMLNTTRPPFDDIRVRQAMQMALDHEAINIALFNDYGDPTPRGIVDIPGYTAPFDEWPDELKRQYSYDPISAEALLDEAGYPRSADGARFKTIYLHWKRFGMDYFQLAAEYYEEIGVDIEISEVDENDFLTLIREHEYEGMASAASGYRTAALPALMLLSDQGQNWSGAEDRTYEARLAAAQAATTVEERQRMVQDANMYMLEQHWLLWGTIARSFNVSQPWVKGYNGESGLGTLDWNALLARLWIDQDLKEAMGY